MFAYTPCMPTTKPNRSESPRSTQTPPCRPTSRPRISLTQLLVRPLTSRWCDQDKSVK